MMTWLEDQCPDKDTHTPSVPYMDFHEWAERMNETHRQTRCPTCRLWAIWVPRETEPA